MTFGPCRLRVYGITGRGADRFARPVEHSARVTHREGFFGKMRHGPGAGGRNTGRFAGMTERSQFRMTKADSPLSTVYYAEVGANA
jgi:hypothetical protein